MRMHETRKWGHGHAAPIVDVPVHVRVSPDPLDPKPVRQEHVAAPGPLVLIPGQAVQLVARALL